MNRTVYAVPPGPWRVECLGWADPRFWVVRGSTNPCWRTYDVDLDFSNEAEAQARAEALNKGAAQ